MLDDYYVPPMTTSGPTPTPTDGPATRKYWIVKNSWGTTWGDDGYIYLAREDEEDAAGQCGLLLQASYPEIKGSSSGSDSSSSDSSKSSSSDKSSSSSSN